MTDDNSNSFAERLKRIEDKNPSASTPRPEPSAWEPPKVRRKSGVSGTTVGIAVCGAVIIGAGLYGYSKMPEGTAAFLAGGPSAIPAMATLQDDAMERFRTFSYLEAGDATGEKYLSKDAQTLDPATYDRVQGRIGYVYGSGFAVSGDTVPVALDAVFDGYAPLNSGTAARDVVPITANADCTLRPVTTGETLVNVNIRHGRDLAPVEFADASDVRETLEDAVKDALKDGQALAAYPTNPNGTQVINVMVTDTSGPLYLALQTLSQNTMWRIHAAPDVEIAHIAMIGPGSAGFAGNVGDASHEMVRAADFYGHFNDGNPYNFSDDPTEIACMSRPFREPNETWRAWAGSAGGDTLDGNLLFGQGKGYAAYLHWFETTTGAQPQTNLVDAYIASHVLVGPVPETPFAAPPVPDTWYFAAHDHIFSGSAADRAAQYQALTADLAVAAAGGDPFAILPPETVISPLEPGVTLATVEGELPTVFGQALHLDTVPDRVSTEDYNTHRTVKFSEKRSLPDLLASGEPMPSEEDLLLYALMRAPMTFADHCAPAVSEIAASCAMIGFEARVRSDGAIGTLATFGYIPRYEMGRFERSTRNDFSGYAFGEKAEDGQFLEPATQAAFVKRLQAVCAAVRAERGNCIISDVGFAVDGASSSRARGRVEVYQQDHNKFEESRTEEIVEAAFAASAGG